MDGEAMINSIQNDDQPLPVVAETAPNVIPTLKDPKFWTAKEKKTRKIYHLWDALERQMRGSEYGEQDRKAAILYEYETFKATEGEQQNQRDVNDALGYKKKAVVVTSDPLALVAEKTKVGKRKEKVEVQTKSEGSDDDDISDLKKIAALLAKAFNHKEYYAKPTNYNLRTYSASSLANKKPKYVKSVEKKEDKKFDEKKRDTSKVKCYKYKKKGNFAKDCKKAKEINENMVFIAKMKRFFYESSSSTEETIAEVAYYTSESESESEFESLEYYDNSTNYGLFVNNDDDQKKFLDAIESTDENFNESQIDSQKDCDKFEVDHNNSEKKDHLIDKLIWKFNHKIAKCHKRIEKANQQSKDLKNQNKDLQDKYDVLINQVNTFEEKNNEFNEQMKVLNEKNDLDTFSSVRRPKHSSVIWKKKGSSNTSNVDLSYIVQICLWIIDSGCSKHMTGNRVLLTNFVEKFLGTVRFGNNDLAVIAGYGDVVIGSMTIKKVYYVKDGVDFLTGDRSSNLYTIALNEVASNSLTCLLAKASSSKPWLWHQRLSYLNFATINNLVKNNLVQGLRKMKFKKDHLCKNTTTKWCRGKEESNLSQSCKNYAYICKPTIVAVLEELNNEAAELQTGEAKPIETDSHALAEPSSQTKIPDINDLPVEENQ
nr:hypothetical protein [Tanacetum cinerariifolium]